MNFVYDVFHWMVQAGQIKMGVRPGPEVAELYEKLVEEEYTEFKDAPTDEKKFDAALDLIWVLIGYCIARTWGIFGGWAEVTRSNFDKFQVDVVTGDIKRRPDGKILKPDTWTGPELKPFLDGEI